MGAAGSKAAASRTASMSRSTSVTTIKTGNQPPTTITSGGTVVGTPVGGAAAAGSSNKGLFYKTNAQGERVMRDTTKGGLLAAGGLALMTPMGGEIASNVVGTASENLGNIGGGLLSGLQPLFLPLSSSCAGIMCLLIMFVVMMNMMQ